MKKYYVGKLYERNGEYEYNQTIFFERDADESPAKALKDIAKHHYDGDRQKEGDGWYFNCGEVYVEACEFKEISEATYMELKGFH